MKRDAKLVAVATAATILAGCASGGGSTYGNDVIGDNPLELLLCAPLFICGAKKSTASTGTSSSTASSSTFTPSSAVKPTTESFVSWNDRSVPTTQVDDLYTNFGYELGTDGVIRFNNAARAATTSTATSTVTFTDDGALQHVHLATDDLEFPGAALPGHPALAYASSRMVSPDQASPFLDFKDPAMPFDYSASAPETVGAVADPYKEGWNYQSFGTWATRTWRFGTGGRYASTFGAPTPGSAVPASGTATFSGELAGTYMSPAWKEGSIAAASLSVGVDFQARSLNFASTGTTITRNLSTATAAPGLNLAGTLTYAPGSGSFSGTLHSASGTMSGTSQGRFYGPAAEELGGVFNLSVPKSTETFVGAYGAKR